MFVIPSQIAKDLVELTQTNRKGVEALYEAETDLAECESAMDRCCLLYTSPSPRD